MEQDQKKEKNKINLDLFRQRSGPGRGRKIQNKFNECTRFQACSFLEGAGWYDYNIAQRLLGHYRMFQHFKGHYSKRNERIPVAQAYIIHFRSRRAKKHYFPVVCTFFYELIIWGEKSSENTFNAFHEKLMNEGFPILEEFLHESENDFETAYHKVFERIKEYPLLDRKPIQVSSLNTQVLAPIQNNYNTENNFIFNNNVGAPSVAKEGATGKEKDVLSKRQWIILLDLISATTTKLKKINFSNPDRIEQAATLLHALSGKDKASFIKELNHYKNNGGLYKTDSLGELNQLIIILTQMERIFEDNNQPDIAELIYKKIKELKEKKERDYPNG